MRLSADFSTETLKAKSDWHEIVKVMKSNDLQQRLLYSVRLSFRIKGETKIFPDNKKLKQFITTKPVIQKMLKGLLKEVQEEKDKTMNNKVAITNIYQLL